MEEACLGYGSYFSDSAANPQVLVVKVPPNLLPRRLGEIDRAFDCNRDYRYCGNKIFAREGRLNTLQTINHETLEELVGRVKQVRDEKNALSRIDTEASSQVKSILHELSAVDQMCSVGGYIVALKPGSRTNDARFKKALLEHGVPSSVVQACIDESQTTYETLSVKQR